MSSKIRELPSPRWIVFYDQELAFIPFEGTLWLSHSDVRCALAEPKIQLTPWDLEFPDELEHVNPRDNSYFFNFEISHHAIRYEAHFSISALRYFIEVAGYRKDDNGLHRRICRFGSLLDELDAQHQLTALIHSHTCANEAVYLRSILDKHPHWERIMELWNLGETEGVIAEVFKIKITTVRSAVQHLEKHGFDVLRGKRRVSNAASHWRTSRVPKVRLSEPN